MRVYLITLKCSHDPKMDQTITRKRSDAASLMARGLAYECIKASAGLDTQWGHAAMQKVESIDPAKGGEVSIREGWRLYVTPSIAPSLRIP